MHILNKTLGAAFAVSALIFMGSCKKDTTPAPVGVGHFYLHLHTNVNKTEIDTTHPIAVDALGRHIKLNVAQFYISSIHLLQANGFYTAAYSPIFLKTIGEEQFYVADVPAGNYLSVSFNVGLSDPVNSSDPSTYPSTSIFAPQIPSMWFGSTLQGYIFLNVQGLVDTSASNTGPVNFPVSYQIGRPSELNGINMPVQNFSIVAGQTYFSHIICDYGALLQGLNFRTQSTANPFTTPSTALQITKAVQGMFRYE
jgi:hypothetical protein